MKQVFTYLIMAIATITFGQKGIVNNGAKITIGNGAYIKISGGQDVGYTNNSGGGVNGQIDLDGEMKISGFFNNYATSDSVFINNNGIGNVVFTGAVSHDISGSMPVKFEGIELIDGGSINISTPTKVVGDLSLTLGLVLLNSSDLTLSKTSVINGTPGVSAMVVLDGVSHLIKEMGGIGSFDFPVGDNSGTVEYSPATVNITSGTFGSDAYVAVGLNNSKQPENIQATDYINRYWTMSQTGVSSFSADVSMNYLNADIVGTETNMSTMRFSNLIWDSLNNVDVSNNKLTATVSEFGDFTGAKASYPVIVSSSGEWSTVIGVTNSMTNVIIQSGVLITISGAKTTEECLNLTILPGGELTNSGNLKVTDELLIKSDATGSGSLINLGTITSNSTRVQQYLAVNTQSYNWHYVSVPIGSATASVFPGVNPGSGTVYASYWDEVADGYVNITNPSTSLSLLKGYAIPSNVSNVIEFSGASLNSGTQMVSNLGYTSASTHAGFHLVGNPFTASVDVLNGAFSMSNTTQDIWMRHDGQFASYNLSSHIGVNGANQYIPLMQGFWIRNNNSGTTTMSITPSSLVHTADEIYKDVDTSYFKLKIYSDQLFDEVAIGFSDGALVNFENFDTEKMLNDNNLYPDLYAIVDNTKTSINSLPSFDQQTYTIPLGMNFKRIGDFKLEADNIDGFNSNVNVYLLDYQNGSEINLRTNKINYINTTESTTDSRFAILLTPKTTGLENLSELINVSSRGNSVVINSLRFINGNIIVYDVSGKVVYSKTISLAPGINNVNINTLTGVYFVQIRSNSKVITKKVIIR